MRARWPFIFSGFLAALVTFASAQLLQPSRSRPPSAPIRISLLAYTNQTTLSRAVFQVTNPTRATFACVVLPQVDMHGRLVMVEPHFPAAPGSLPARGSFTFTLPADGRRCCAVVQFWEVQPAWKERAASLLGA